MAANGTVKKVKVSGHVKIAIPRIDIRTFTLTLVGDSSLVCHKWSEKAKGMMRATQMGEAKQKKAPKNPDEDFHDSMYLVRAAAGGKPAVYGFPSVAFKSAAVDACSFVDGVTKVEARGAFHIVGDMIPLESKAGPVRREDMVRVGMGTADIRYRGEFKDWSVTLTIRYNANVLTPAEIINLFNVAGFAIGVGEHRPQCNGSWGMFHVMTSA